MHTLNINTLSLWIIISVEIQSLAIKNPINNNNILLDLVVPVHYGVRDNFLKYLKLHAYLVTVLVFELLARHLRENPEEFDIKVRVSSSLVKTTNYRGFLPLVVSACPSPRHLLRQRTYTNGELILFKKLDLCYFPYLKCQCER